jgi:NADH-quinone oxidoreductase subunit H
LSQLLTIVADWLVPLLLYPGLIFALILAWLGYLIAGWITSSRVGLKPPRPLQPLFDYLKLATKQVRPLRGVNSGLLALLAVVSFAAPILAVALLPLPGSRPVVVPGDVVAAIYLLEVPTFALILLGQAVPSPFGRRSAARQIVLTLSSSVPVVLAVIAVATEARSFVLADLVAWPSTSLGIAARALAALAFLVTLPAWIRTGPFDSPVAREEILEGASTDSAGVPLAVFRLANAIARVGKTTLFVVLFVPPIGSTLQLAAATYLAAFLAIVVVVAFVASLSARFRIDQIPSVLLWGRGFWPSPTVVALAALLLPSVARLLD